MKPELQKVLEIVAMKKEATALYDEIDKRILEIKEVFGSGRFDYDLTGLPEGEETPYLKVEITDNIKELLEQGIVWKSTGFKPVSFSSRGLKRCPASLKVTKH